jgi:hypothetical protein
VADPVAVQCDALDALSNLCTLVLVHAAGSALWLGGSYL